VNGGICEIAGRKWIFVDLALPVDEQLGLVIQAIKGVVDHEEGSGGVVPEPRSARAA
jgi:hypothetical protein